MSHLGDFSGSEFHLLRFLGRHRGYFDARVLERVGETRIEWLDAPFERRMAGPDAQLCGVEFTSDKELCDAWLDFFPTRASCLGWDAVARLGDDGESWLLLDANSHIDELRSRCSARASNFEQIRSALDHTKAALGVDPGCDWLNGYYRVATRLAALLFLRERGVRAHLLSLYFIGDEAPRRLCPEDADEWKTALEEQVQHLGLPVGHALHAFVHELFLPVCPNDQG